MLSVQMSIYNNKKINTNFGQHLTESIKNKRLEQDNKKNMKPKFSTNLTRYITLKNNWQKSN